MVRRICLFSEDMASFFRGITPKYIILTGCLFTLLFAFFSNEVYHPDEHFQILEYAHMKLFGTPVPAELPWEYVLMMRPGLQPMIAYGLGWLLDAGGIYSPYLLFSLLHVLSGALSVVSVLAFYRAVRGTLSGPSEEKWLLLLSFFLWFMVYLHVRFSSETFSGNLLLLLVSVYLSYGQRERKRPFVWGAGMGLLAGAAFISRYQVGFALFGFGLWLLVFARRWRLLAGLALGGAAMLGVGVLVDYWLYGTWTCSPVNYLRENILNSHIDKFGIKPWYFYLSDTVSKGSVVYGLAILAATCWFFVRNPKHVITWTMVPFLLAHQLVGHKELRFLFPVLPFIPFFAVLLARDLPRQRAGVRAEREGRTHLLQLRRIHDRPPRGHCPFLHAAQYGASLGRFHIGTGTRGPAIAQNLPRRVYLVRRRAPARAHCAAGGESRLESLSEVDYPLFQFQRLGQP